MADSSRTLSLAATVAPRVLAVLSLVLPRVFYGLSWAVDDVGYTCPSGWEPSDLESASHEVLWYAQLVLPALVVAAVVAELYGRRRAMLGAAALASSVATGMIVTSLAFPERNPCTGASLGAEIPWMPLGCYAVAIVCSLLAARTPLIGRRPRRVELLAWTAAGLLTLLPCLPSYSWEPYDWTCDPDFTGAPELYYAIYYRMDYVRAFALPGAYTAVLAAAAIPFGRRTATVVGALPLFAVGLVYSVLEFAMPTCGGSRVVAASRAADWPLVATAALIVFAAVAAVRPPRVRLKLRVAAPADFFPAEPQEPASLLMIVAVGVALCGIAWLVFSYFGFS